MCASPELSVAAVPRPPDFDSTPTVLGPKPTEPTKVKSRIAADARRIRGERTKAAGEDLPLPALESFPIGSGESLLPFPYRRVFASPLSTRLDLRRPQE